MSAYGDWVFERTGGLCRVRGADGLVLAASAAAPGSGIGGVDTLGIPQASSADASSHHMRLRFRSRGFFSSEPDAHFALGIAGEWRKANPAVAQSGLLAGAGVIIGNVAGAPNGCAEAPVVQIESFYADGNALFADTGSARLQEETWYALEISVTSNGRVSYELRGDSGRIAGADIVDASNRLPKEQGGWWITHVFSDIHLHRDWSFEISALEVE